MMTADNSNAEQALDDVFHSQVVFLVEKAIALGEKEHPELAPFYNCALGYVTGLILGEDAYDDRSRLNSDTLLEPCELRRVFNSVLAIDEGEAA